jgi:uncharacterized membrane protein
MFLEMSKERTAVLKGISMVAVILHHIQIIGGVFGGLEPETFERSFFEYLAVIGCGVFFLTSGYGLSIKRDSKRILFHSVPRLLGWYFAYMCLYALVQRPANIIEFYNFFSFGWFINSMLLLYTFSVVGFLFKKKYTAEILITVAVVGYAVTMDILSLYKGYQMGARAILAFPVGL